MPTTTADAPEVLAGIEAAAGDYPFGGPHVALAGQGPRLARAAVEAAGALNAPLLLASAPEGDRWAWVATKDAAGLRARLEAFEEPIGFAGPLNGRPGFATAHRQARLAVAGAAVAGRGAGVVMLADVALEALVAGDADDAREVVRVVLGPLAAPGQATARLRATLEASLTAAAGRAEVADRLHVAPRTVSYRLRRAEDLLGHPIAPRRAELATALRLFRALGP